MGINRESDRGERPCVAQADAVAMIMDQLLIRHKEGVARFVALQCELGIGQWMNGGSMEGHTLKYDPPDPEAKYWPRPFKVYISFSGTLKVREGKVDARRRRGLARYQVTPGFHSARYGL
jgi:hypothetical protein